MNREALKAFIIREVEKNKSLAIQLQSTDDAQNGKMFYIGYEHAMQQVLKFIEPFNPKEDSE